MIVLATLRDNVPAVGHLARVVQDIYVRLHELRKEVVMTCTLAAGNLASAIVGDDFLTFEMYGDTLQTAMRVVNAAPPGSLTCSDRFFFIYECWQEEQLLVYEYYYEEDGAAYDGTNNNNNNAASPSGQDVVQQRSDEFNAAKDTEVPSKTATQHQNIRNSVSDGKRQLTVPLQGGDAAGRSIKQDPAASYRKKQAMAAAGASLSMSAAVQRKSIMGMPPGTGTIAGGLNASMSAATRSQLRKVLDQQKRRGLTKIGGGDGSGAEYPLPTPVRAERPLFQSQSAGGGDRPDEPKDPLPNMTNDSTYTKRSTHPSSGGLTGSSHTANNLSGVNVAIGDSQVLQSGVVTACPVDFPQDGADDTLQAAEQPQGIDGATTIAIHNPTADTEIADDGEEAAGGQVEEAYEEEYEEFSSPFEIHDPLPWKLRGRGVVAIRYVSVYSYEAKQ
eukprot:GILI01007138.1.p1 GENE.GILI01007138.1~~GILI01007138.1.p1  ORF type:complete len:486 (-),score=118.78 GILI01007138.1:210-1544(-)